MTFEAAHNSIRGGFDTLVATPESLTTIYDNDFTDSPQTGLHAVLAVVDGQSFQVELGAVPRHRNPGTMIAALRDDIEKGDQALLDLADKIVAAFRGVTLDGLVHFRTPSITRLGREGKWWDVNVACPYYHDDVV